MRLLSAVLTAALLTGYALGGRLRSLAGVRIRWWWLAPVALATQGLPVPALGGAVGRWLPVAALLLSYALLLVVAVANLRLFGFPLVVIGLAMNLLVIAANRGMPVSESALRRAGFGEDIQTLRGDEGEKHHLASEQDVLLPLADVIGIGGPLPVVVSAGDLAAYGGAAAFLARAMLAATPRPRHRRLRARRSGTRP